MIASDIAGIHEALDNGRCGMLVPARDVSKLVEAITTLLGDSELRLTFANLARQRAEDKFDMWRNGQALADLLRNTKRAEATSHLRPMVQTQELLQENKLF